MSGNPDEVSAKGPAIWLVEVKLKLLNLIFDDLVMSHLLTWKEVLRLLSLLLGFCNQFLCVFFLLAKWTVLQAIFP